jgi:hypothetical protein
MKIKIICLPLLLFLSGNLASQDTTYQPPSNIRYSPEHLSSQVDLIWTPPAGWVHSAIDRWYDWDQGIWDGNSLGSCMDCPAEAGSKWDAAMISMYDTVYLTKIRYILIEPEIHYRLKVYQGTPGSFDTLLVHPLEDNIVYNVFDTLDLDPILLDTSKDFWLVYWVNSLASGYPLPMGAPPAMIGYGNLINFGNGWDTITSINPDIDFNWSIGGYLETPNDTIIYPLFNVYRAIDDGPFEKITESPCLDTILYDYIGHDLDPSHLYYYVTCVYEDGESEPSGILDVSFVNIIERKESAFKVFPNPATDYVSIESVKGKMSSVSLINSQGKVVLERNVSDQKISLDISHLNSSFYIIKVTNADGVFTSKLLIVK